MGNLDPQRYVSSSCTHMKPLVFGSVMHCCMPRAVLLSGLKRAACEMHAWLANIQTTTGCSYSNLIFLVWNYTIMTSPSAISAILDDYTMMSFPKSLLPQRTKAPEQVNGVGLLLALFAINASFAAR